MAAVAAPLGAAISAQHAAAEALGPARPPVPTAQELLSPLLGASATFATVSEQDRETLRVAGLCNRL